MVASDRISIFDFVLDTTIPDKGEILTRMSLWWFEQLADLVPNHVVVDRRPGRGRRPGGDLRAARDVPGRVRRPRLPRRLGAARLPRDRRGVRHRRCPPAWSTGAGCPSRSSPRPPRPRSASTTRTSPTTPWSPRSAATPRRSCATLTLAVYATAEAIARDRGIILADTKLEFGRRATAPTVLADEVLTPDSSRYWPADRVGARPRPAVVRQADRAQLALSPESGWDRASGEPPPPLPDEVVERTRARYVEAYELLTGETF